MPNIIGTAPNQVPTNADLGTMAYQDSNAVKVKDITFNDGSSQQTAASGFGFKNRIINGDMRVSQRGSVAVTNNTANYGGADRTLCAPLSFTTASGTLNKLALNGTTSGYAQWLTNLTTTGSGTLVFGQRIESLNCLDLNSKSVTFTGVAYQDTGSTVSLTVEVSKANALDNFTGVTRIGSAVSVSVPSATLTPFSITVTLGAADANNGLYPSVTFTGLGALTNKSFAVSDLQLEKGSTATSFDYRPYGTEERLCMRYYQRIRAYPRLALGAGPGNFPTVALSFLVTMRATPTTDLTIVGNYGTSPTSAPTSTTAAYVGASGGTLDADVILNLTAEL